MPPGNRLSERPLSSTSETGRPRSLWLSLEPTALGLLGVSSVIAIWHAAVFTETVSPLTLPPPAEVGRRIVDLLTIGEFYSQLANTTVTWLLAMVLTIMVAIPLGLLIGSVPLMYPPTAGLVHLLRSIPSTSLVPVAIAFFGLGSGMKVAVVAFAIAWPLFLHALYGAQAVNPLRRDTARSVRLNRWQTLRSLILPSAAQYIGTGVRLAGGIGLVVVLSTELLGASRGIGTLIVRYQRAELPGFVYAGIVLIGVLGITLYHFLNWIERSMSPWAPEHRHS